MKVNTRFALFILIDGPWAYEEHIYIVNVEVEHGGMQFELFKYLCWKNKKTKQNFWSWITQKETLFAHIYRVDSWIVYNFVGCGFDAKSELVILSLFFKIALKVWSNPEATCTIFPSARNSVMCIINNSFTPISNSWGMKARLHVIITFTVFLMNINQTLRGINYCLIDTD